MSGGAGRRRPRFGPSRGELRATAAAVALACRTAPGHVLAHLALTGAIGAAPVAVAWLTKLLLDRLAAPSPGASVPQALAGLVIVLAVAGGAAAVAPHASRYIAGELHRRSRLAALDRLYAALNRLTGIARFEDPAFHDRLRLAQQGGESGPAQALDGALGVLQGAVTLAGFVVSLTVLSPVMTAAVVAGAVPALIAELALSHRRAALLRDTSPAARRELFYAGLLSDLQAAKEVRLFGIGAFLRGRMLTELRTINAATRRLERREVLAQTGLALLAAVVSGAGLAWAANAAWSGRLTIGSLSLFVAGVASVQGALGGVVRQLAETHQAALLFDHYLTVVTEGPDLPVAPNLRPARRLRRGLELKDVWFRYGDAHPWVLSGVDLRVPHGHALALVGVNGAGKSTLVKLLCRLYDPTRGAVLWDGVDLRELDPAQLRSRIGAVFQDFMCYDLTAAENIGLGMLSSMDDRDRIHSAARRAGLHDTLASLPWGYDTLLSRIHFSAADKADPRTGVVLSGGQWQRLALARAFLRDACDLLILDEPSAGLDAEAEHAIHHRLREHRAGRTSLLISHRLGAVRDADTIAVLADGRIAERGRHAELLAAGGAYARLFTLQAEGYRPVADDGTAAPDPVASR